MPNSDTIIHLEQYGDGFYTAEYNKGVSYYEFSDHGKIKKIKQYGSSEFEKTNLYIVDINTHHLEDKNIIYALDGR